jgi:hypothetical protein
MKDKRKEIKKGKTSTQKNIDTERKTHTTVLLDINTETPWSTLEQK